MNILTPLLDHLLRFIMLFRILYSDLFILLSAFVSPTVEQMAEMGKAVLRDQGITDMSDIR